MARPCCPTAPTPMGPKGDRGGLLGLPPDSGGPPAASGELESSSFIDSDEDDNTSRWVRGGGCMCGRVCAPHTYMYACVWAHGQDTLLAAHCLQGGDGFPRFSLVLPL